MQITVATTATVEDLVWAFKDSSYEEIVEFVRSLDTFFRDWGLTKRLHDLTTELMKEYNGPK